MAFAAAYMGVGNALVIFFAMRVNFDFGLADKKWAADFAIQNHVFTAICHQNVGHRAGFTQTGLPDLGRVAPTQKAALFEVAPTEVVPIKITAFFSRRCTHERDYSTALVW